MKNHLIFSLFIVSILALCGCTVDSASGQSSAGAETPKSLALCNLVHTIDDMVLVEGGTFQMGGTEYDNEQPVHEVTVSSFYMGKHEVTQVEYQKIMGSNPSYFEGDKLPVESVSWHDAVNYCNKRSVAEGLTACYTINGNNVTCNWSANGYRLPSEAEWEYAAKGGIHKSASKYSGSNDIDKVAWYSDNSDNETHEVGKKKANALGIYDMSGNVWEWCWDWYDSDYYSSSPANNPLGPASGSGRVFRGGGWGVNASSCRCTFRNFSSPGCKCNYRGFRVVRSIVATDSKEKPSPSKVKKAPKNMVYVEGGTFQMGGTKYNDEQPVHEVTVSSFYMGKYEVTQAEWGSVMGTTLSDIISENGWSSYGIGDNYPMYDVSWYDAVKYCNKRSEAEGLTPCYTINGNNVTCNWNANGYRLPTEAEWEYAARGGKHKSTYKYSGSDNIDEVAWYWGNSGSGLDSDDPDYGTHEVGKKQANALGIYDMSGNVWEWCWDWYGEDYYGSSVGNNPVGPASGSSRVLRGGGWGNDASNCRCAGRDRGNPDSGYGDWGFRVVRSSK